MKLIQWLGHQDIEAYTTCSYTENNELMNMSYNGINDANVLKNRKQLMKQLHSNLDLGIATVQQHTTNFIEVSKEDCGKGMYFKEDAIIGYDAMYTRDKNIWLFSFHADCCPVLLYCENQGIIAEIHSGWKGTVNEIVCKVTKHLIENENCFPQDIYAYIGPSIIKENFEAKEDIITLVQKMSFDTSKFYQKKDETTYLLDSKGLIKQQLLNLGVKNENITTSPYCTIRDNHLFFSYRKNKTPHRNITIIKRK